ncbi:class I SAM-dependent DNA methyltransferase [Acidicapsa dinghuensis]|uniref:Class I SAM-dependent DNA methyltransferase n=1 Tax=Acidicapsa dinghuensis TaxID=2218256 RepID=A0ABW1EDI5_9BACT|nr:class I SAM-dependent methyltransferase [Acidicapsa dinghuensis]
MRPSAEAFDSIAPVFDDRFGQWLSVAAQRRMVRTALLQEFPAGGRIIELGGGTGEDALFLAQQGFRPFLTDPSPTMISLASAKLAPFHAQAEVVAAEEYDDFASRHVAANGTLFDGAFSNFAPLNCVANLQPVASGLAKLLKPGAPAMLVVFGTFCPGEWITEVLRGRPGHALRRCRRDATPARIAGHNFHVVYHRRTDLMQAFAPWFVLEKRLGIGVALPPSAAEPWISGHPRLLRLMETIDRAVSRRMAIFGDHILYQFRRTSV